MKSALALSAIAMMTVLASLAANAASEPCSASDNDSLLKCYQQEYQDKYRANKERYEGLAEQAKENLQSAAENEDKKKVAAVTGFVRKLSGSIVSHRKSASTDCTKLVGKFASQETAAIASVNCRTGYEVKLDQRLRALESELEELLADPKIDRGSKKL